MKIILSRKGFDSANGGVASPILPDGSLLSLPIPAHKSAISYADLHRNDYSLGAIVEDLTKQRITRSNFAHLDPDLNADIFPRHQSWRPLFGQAGAAQSHLAHCGISSGDLFLFFGWFRQVACVDGHYRFVAGTPDLHVIFGWLQIDTILSVRHGHSDVPAWAQYHPHLHESFAAQQNTLYIARDKLKLDGIPTKHSGASIFKKYHKHLCLTAPGETRTVWSLPAWFHPRNGSTPLSYHANMERWSSVDKHTVLRSVARGQEFVLDTEQYPEAIEWAHKLIAHGTD